MAGISGHRSAVENLMESEDARPRVGLAQGVDDGAEDVAGTAGAQQHHHGWPRIRRIPEHHHISQAVDAEDDVHHRIQPAWCIDPDHMNHDGDGRARPHRYDDHIAPERFQRKRNRGIRAGNEQEDVDMIDTPQHIGDARAPIAQMVAGRIGEQNQRRCHEHGTRPLQTRAMCQAYKHDACRQ